MINNTKPLNFINLSSKHDLINVLYGVLSYIVFCLGFSFFFKEVVGYNTVQISQLILKPEFGAFSLGVFGLFIAVQLLKSTLIVAKDGKALDMGSVWLPIKVVLVSSLFIPSHGSSLFQEFTNMICKWVG